MSGHFRFGLFTAVSVTLALTLAPVAASANSSRGQLLVSVNVLRECSIAVQELSTQSAASSRNVTAVRGSVSVNCSRNTAYDVTLGPQAGLAKAPQPVSTSGVGNGNAQIIPVYSRMPAGYDSTSGTRANTLVMTINY